MKSLNLTPYLITIVIAFLTIGTVDYFVTDYPLWFIALSLLGSIVYVIAVHGLANAFMHLFVNKINPTSKYFNVSKTERNFWGRIGAKTFKKYVPDLGALVKFPKNKIINPKDPEYLYKYLKESAIGELGHTSGAVMGFTLMFFVPSVYWWYWVLPAAIINAIMAILPIIVLRYNRCTLLLMYKRVSVTVETK